MTHNAQTGASYYFKEHLPRSSSERVNFFVLLRTHQYSISRIIILDFDLSSTVPEYPAVSAAGMKGYHHSCRRV